MRAIIWDNIQSNSQHWQWLFITPPKFYIYNQFDSYDRRNWLNQNLTETININRYIISREKMENQNHNQFIMKNKKIKISKIQFWYCWQQNVWLSILNFDNKMFDCQISWSSTAGRVHSFQRWRLNQISKFNDHKTFHAS